jgi:hypothetical protein
MERKLSCESQEIMRMNGIYGTLCIGKFMMDFQKFDSSKENGALVHILYVLLTRRDANSV